MHEFINDDKHKWTTIKSSKVAQEESQLQGPTTQGPLHSHTPLILPWHALAALDERNSHQYQTQIYDYFLRIFIYWEENARSLNNDNEEPRPKQEDFVHSLAIYGAYSILNIINYIFFFKIFGWQWQMHMQIYVQECIMYTFGW